MTSIKMTRQTCRVPATKLTWKLSRKMVPPKNQTSSWTITIRMWYWQVRISIIILTATRDCIRRHMFATISVITLQNRHMIERLRACCICRQIIRLHRKWVRTRQASRRLHDMCNGQMLSTRIQVIILMDYYVCVLYN